MKHITHLRMYMSTKKKSFRFKAKEFKKCMRWWLNNLFTNQPEHVFKNKK